MAQHQATVSWERNEVPFTDQKYSRVHRWDFDGGAVWQASASPANVPVPYSDPALVDPEEAFVAALSSCHMLWFLALAAKDGWIVESYRDRANGTMVPNEDGVKAFTEVVLAPAVEWSGRSPSGEQVEALHARAQENCFLAQSVRFPVRTLVTGGDA